MYSRCQWILVSAPTRLGRDNIQTWRSFGAKLTLCHSLKNNYDKLEFLQLTQDSIQTLGCIMIQKSCICFTYLLWLSHRETNLYVVSQFIFSLFFLLLFGWGEQNLAENIHIIFSVVHQLMRLNSLKYNLMPIISVEFLYFYKYLFSNLSINCISFFNYENRFSSLG